MIWCNFCLNKSMSKSWLDKHYLCSGLQVLLVLCLISPLNDMLVLWAVMDLKFEKNIFRLWIYQQTNKQYLMWKLKYSAIIWYPIEVFEVQIAASGGQRNGQGPKKVWSKIMKSAIFELHKHYTPQKKVENNRHKIRWFFMKKLIKIGFEIFNPKKLCLENLSRY